MHYSQSGILEKCHPKTRVDLLSQIQNWASEPLSKPILWLHGKAGTGKSTISWTIAEWLTSQESLVSLGASFFFRRGESGRNSAERFFPTIIRQLVTKIFGLDVLVARAIESDPLLFSKAPAEQFRRLMLRPLQDLTVAGAHQPTLVVVVDALDECEDKTEIRTILELWPQLSQVTVVRLRLFLTSRPECDVRLSFQDMSINMFRAIDLVDAVPLNTIQYDLFTYLSDSLCSVREEYNRRHLGQYILSHEWPDCETIQQLVSIAVPLFIVAATICRFVGDYEFDPQESLEVIVRDRATGQMTPMESTYLPVLNHLTTKSREENRRDKLYHEFRTVVGSILLLAEPLSVSSLSTLLSMPIPSINRRITPLHSVLLVPSDCYAPIRTLHLSFAEFL